MTVAPGGGRGVGRAAAAARVRVFAVANMGAGGRGRLQWRALRCLACTCFGSTLIQMGLLQSFGVSSVQKWPSEICTAAELAPPVRGEEDACFGGGSWTAVPGPSFACSEGPGGSLSGVWKCFAGHGLRVARLHRRRHGTYGSSALSTSNDVDDWSSNALGQSYWWISKARIRVGCGCPVLVDELVGVALVVDGRKGALRLV